VVPRKREKLTHIFMECESPRSECIDYWLIGFSSFWRWELLK
jgi:hypothetical protein